MSIKRLKKIRILLTYIVGVIFFIVMQFLSDPEGNVGTPIQAFGVGILIFGLLFVLFSDWMYYNELINKGAKIKYETFQKVGLLFNITALCIIISAAYNEIYNGNIGVLSLFIEVPLIYLLIYWIFLKNSTVK